MEASVLIVGLGNPGREYEQTRHNAGFMAVDEIARRRKAGWSIEKRFNAKMARTEIAGKTVWLCQPQTYMNLSGEAVAAVLRFYRIGPEGLMVSVDDADLPVGTIRLKPQGSSGGHHGLESIEQHLATRVYARQRIGIGRRDSSVREISGHVLGTFAADEVPVVKKVLERAANQIECWIGSGLQKAMNQFNGAIDGAEQKESK